MYTSHHREVFKGFGYGRETLIGRKLLLNISSDFFFKVGVISAVTTSIGQTQVCTVLFSKSLNAEMTPLNLKRKTRRRCIIFHFLDCGAHVLKVKMFKFETSVLVKHEVFNCLNAGMVHIFFNSS